MPEVKDEVAKEVETPVSEEKKLEEIKSVAKEVIKDSEVKEDTQTEEKPKETTSEVEPAVVEANENGGHANGKEEHSNGYSKETNGHHANGAAVEETDLKTETKTAPPSEDKTDKESPNKTTEVTGDNKSETVKEEVPESEVVDSKPAETPAEEEKPEPVKTAEAVDTEVDKTSVPDTIESKTSEPTESTEVPETTSAKEAQLEVKTEGSGHLESKEVGKESEIIETKETAKESEPVENKEVDKESVEPMETEKPETESVETEKTEKESVETKETEKAEKEPEQVEVKEPSADTTEKMENSESQPEVAPAEGSAGGSKEPATVPQEVSDMISEGRICLLKNNFSGAADLLGSACEKMRELFGELHDACGPVYYYYGWAMLECAKTEGDVLGEEVKKKEGEEEDDSEEEEEDENKEENGEEKKEDSEGEKKEEKVEPKEEEKSPDDAADKKTKEEEAAGDEKMETEEEEEKEVVPEADTTLKKEGEEEEEEEDTTLKAAWETLELAKIIFERLSDNKMLSDVYMKLGEVAVESGNKEGIDDMKRCLEIRTEVYPATHRAIPETHFNIGLSFSLFQLFDDAIHHFTLSKALLKQRIESLSNDSSAEAGDEVKELKELLPEIDDKIRDMNESKVEKQKAEASLKGTSGEAQAGSAAPVSALNASLIKRKRKIAEVTSDLPGQKSKQPKQES